MSNSIGDAGGIRVAPESTYGVAGTAFAVQHAMSATLAPSIPLLDIPCLGVANPATREYGVSSVPGDMTLCYNDSRAVIGDILAAGGNLSTDTYTFGAGTAPDTASLTAWIDHGGTWAMQYLGCVVVGLRWEFQPNSSVQLTVTYLGKSFASQTPVTLTPPSETGIIWDSDLGTTSVGGTTLGFLSGTIDVQFPVVGEDRHTLRS